METNNIFTESYDDPIIDDSLDNEIDILSTDDGTTMDYDEIPDYAAVSVDDDTRTVTLERYCEEFKQKVLRALETSSFNTVLYFIDKYGYETDIQDIDNLYKYALWDGEYVTNTNTTYEKLMSFNSISQHVTFNIYYNEESLATNNLDIDVNHTRANVEPRIVDDIYSINGEKIISIRDFEDLAEVTHYFIISAGCAPENYCEPEWVCDLDCTRIEYDEY